MNYIILGISVAVLFFVFEDIYSRIRFLQKKSLQHDISTDALYDIIAFWMNYDKEKIEGSFETAKKKFIPGYAEKSRQAWMERDHKEEMEKMFKNIDAGFAATKARRKAEAESSGK